MDFGDYLFARQLRMSDILYHNQYYILAKAILLTKFVKISSYNIVYILMIDGIL